MDWIPGQPMMILVCGPIRRNSRSMASQMQKHGTAAAGDARAKVVIDLDDEVIEVILARQPVSGLIVDQPDRLVVMAVLRIFAPGIFGPDRPRRQIGLRPRMPVGAPP
jgi:hypothetical protein